VKTPKSKLPANWRAVFYPDVTTARDLAGIVPRDKAAAVSSAVNQAFVGQMLSRPSEEIIGPKMLTKRRGGRSWADDIHRAAGPFMATLQGCRDALMADVQGARNSGFLPLEEAMQAVTFLAESLRSEQARLRPSHRPPTPPHRVRFIRAVADILKAHDLHVSATLDSAAHGAPRSALARIVDLVLPHAGEPSVTEHELRTALGRRRKAPPKP
jgi:hypothetical protein